MRRVGGLDGVPLLVLAGQAGHEVAEARAGRAGGDGLAVAPTLVGRRLLVGDSIGKK